MGLKGKIEAIIYAAEEPITLDQVAFLMKEPVLQEIAAEQERAAAEAQESAAQQAAQDEQNDNNSVVEVEVPRSARDDNAVSATDVAVAAVSTGDVVSESETGADESSTPAAGEAPAVPPEAAETAKAVVAPRRKKNEVPPEVKARVKALILELTDDYANNDRGMEIRHVAGGFRMATKPEHHDIVKAFAKSLKPPLRLSLPALETLAVVAYKQPVTAPEVSDIRGVDSQGVMATLLERKLVTTAGRKAVIGRPILYKTTKEFLLRFGLNEISELPSMEEFEKLAQEQVGLFISEGEAEPTLSPEEASARLEQASAAVEDGAASEGEAPIETGTEGEPVASSAAPDDEAHQS